jgi:hypothetical protein
MKFTPQQFMANTVQRSLSKLFPSIYGSEKHDHNKDYGYPDSLHFGHFYNMYKRNGMAKASVRQTVLKTWQDNPAFWESDDSEETTLEKEIRQRLDDLRFWQRVAEVDKRSLVGGYAGFILRLADSKRFKEPVDRVGGGLDGLVEIIPAWAGQLEVSTWDTDETSETYGEPTMFSFNEASVGADVNKTRSFEVHPARVIVWSEDGTVHPDSALEAGYNDLLDLQKISGAGGEGFWKNAKRGLAFEIDKETQMQAMADSMGVPIAEVADKLGEAAEDFNKGFDSSLLLQGMKVDTVAVTMPSPEHFHAVSLMGFAASMTIPVKILVGSQTGERASTEDADAWSQTNMARRSGTVIPTLRLFIERLERFGILPERDWVINWSDLTENSASAKADLANKMADTNNKSQDEPIYSVGEIRLVTGHDGEEPDGVGEEE